MDDEDRGPRLSKRLGGDGEVDYKTKSGSAWSHSYLNQKPWHPLSYPNQRRKWIAEQTHAQRERRAEEVAREYAQEQEFFRQAALVSKKDQEKMEMMKAVSFMYVRPPGYNAESAKAAEIAEEKKPSQEAGTSDMLQNPIPPNERTKKPRPKDVFGRNLPTEEQFEALKNAPKLETGVAGRAKPFGIEIRNVKCVRCGAFGHQSGDRECPLKDAIMPNEESRLKRDDPLTAIIAQTEPLKWELKQKPGMSPPRGGFRPDDPNQQIVAEDIFDEYGGFLGEEVIPNLLANFSTKKEKKSSSKRKHKGESPPMIKDHQDSLSSDDAVKRSKTSKSQRKKKKKRIQTASSSSVDSEDDRRKRSRSGRRKRRGVPESLDSDQQQRYESCRRHHHSSDSDQQRRYESRRRRHHHNSDSDQEQRYESRRRHHHRRHSNSSD
ncbi:putative transcription factor interactor and regulator CCHC(Zn) family [Helianthus annuus]|uniref:Putative CBF1-interacting co-repressor CIR, N-terminal domain-containing protein n=1 Tax=Helianthus annuus TaxID=4232 RepID=A0A251UC39_HELAN|nr:uncharacterized zinc finger CCHC domain-containing protein At4g19190 [Helianthus annuus]KAF5797938.1 putative transcription factor interactor and regulator CCHC(Zn) family [Helianthus annuus]KAJ0549608.1 putative transcription factor interactor and regulator CCHC(Zn) family [Helianthus annuus]KAJ0556065.1 putative transcription factor interactor and regulator CCHC(Zn) family [Helianthus annuus]KAJ0562563.1 putative transcription factor interactor and regulator CCHC(Zn) family [Helianthus ann